MAILCIKPHLPPRDSGATILKSKASDFVFVRRPLFWILLMATVVQATAQFIPSNYITSYAVDVGLGSSKGSLLLSLINLAEDIGQPLIGMLV